MLGNAPEALVTFTTIFLGIFIEAVPFLLLGTLASGFVEVYVEREQLLRLMPRRALPAAVAGGLLGVLLPVCECGTIPLTQRLCRKGMPLSAGMAFLLASPIINPLTIGSTLAAYGWSAMFWARMGLGLLVAVSVALVFQQAPAPERLLRAPLPVGGAAEDEPLQRASSRFLRALRLASDDFFDMGRYLVIGCALAALMQTIVPQTALLAIGKDAVSSVFVMQALAFLLSVCSTVDAFLSLAFVNTFTTGSVLAFLVFGPMVDIKSALMMSGVFQRRVVLYLLVLPWLMTALAAIFINLNVRWAYVP